MAVLAELRADALGFDSCPQNETAALWPPSSLPPTEQISLDQRLLATAHCGDTGKTSSEERDCQRLGNRLALNADR